MRARLCSLVSLTVLLGAVHVPVAAASGPGGPLAQSPTGTRGLTEPVEVSELTTETRKVMANPDGTFTAEVSVLPVRVRSTAGGWRDVNTNLTQRADGTIGPAVAPVQISFSGGGSGPLVEVSEDGKGFGLTWPEGPLPAPAVDGETATYPNVLPGVDLVLEAGVTGFATYFVVKTPEAAANPELAALRFGLEGDSLTVAADAGGGLVARDATGRVVFSGPPARMWDSTTSSATAGATTEATPDDVSVIEEPQGARAAPVKVSVSGGTVSITPDAALLKDPDVTFPLVIDPAVSRSQKRTYWTMVWSNGYTFPNSSTEKARVGYELEEQDKKSHVFYRFDVSAFAGKHVIAATFRHAQTHSWYNDCGGTKPQGVEVGRTGGISSSTSWPGPSIVQSMGVNYTNHGNRDNCPGFTEAEWNAEAVVEFVAGQKLSTLTLGMQSNDDNDPQGWWNFATNSTYPVLTVQYNSAPNTPSSVRVKDPSTACIGSQADAPVISSVTPQLQAYLRDPDGTNGDLRGRFEVYDVGESAPAWIYTTSADAPSGTTEYVRVPSGELTSGHLYRLRVRAQEYIAESWDYSAWSGWCYFRPDTSHPSPPIVASTDYPPHDPKSEKVYGGVGQLGTFTINGVSDVVEYRWRINNRDWRASFPTNAGDPVSIPAWPDRVGINTFQAVAIDRAGNPSTKNYYHFIVAPGTPATGVWKLDETSGTTAADSSGNPNLRPLTLQGGTWSGLGRSANSLLLDGVDDSAAAAGSAVSTFNSFTVAAWVRLDSAATNQAVARQATTDGVHEFLLYYSAGSNRWGFQKQNQDNPAFAGTVYSKAPPAVGAWTHLAGVYDASTNRMLLYVNGVLDSTYQLSSSPWFANGRFEVGSWHYPGVAGAPFKGRIDEVRIWNRWVAPGELAPFVDNHDVDSQETPELVAQWSFDSETAPLADSSGYGLTLTAATGASVVTDPDAGGVLQVTGDAAGYARTSSGRVAVDGTGSFTVTAWVKPTDATHTGAVVAQGNSTKDTFEVGTSRSSPSRWRFGRTTTGTGSAEALSESTLASDEYGQWRHVAAVYDRISGTITLYVDGVPQYEETGVSFTDPWHATQPVILGREWAGVDTSTSFAGQLDDVRIYTGELSRTAIHDQWLNG